MSKERIYTTLTLVFAFLQTFVPTLGLGDVATGVITSVLITLVSVFTLLKQRISVEINKKAVYATWVLVAIAALGGINDIASISGFSDAIHMSNTVQTILKNAIVGLIGLLNIMSKSLFPTDEAKAIEAQKKELKSIQKLKQ